MDKKRGFIGSLPLPMPDGACALLAAGILGATVMPHATFLHSAMTRKRMCPDDEPDRMRLFRFELIDVLDAMSAQPMQQSRRPRVYQDETEPIDELAECAYQYLGRFHIKGCGL